MMPLLLLASQHWHHYLHHHDSMIANISKSKRASQWITIYQIKLPPIKSAGKNMEFSSNPLFTEIKQSKMKLIKSNKVVMDSKAFTLPTTEEDLIKE